MYFSWQKQRQEQDRATVQAWLQAVLQRDVEDDLHAALKDGTLLCEVRTHFG